MAILGLVGRVVCMWSLFGPEVALVSLAPLLTYHWHLQLSRQGLVYVQATLFAAWAIGIFGMARNRASPRLFALSGLVAGLGCLTYPGARIVPLILGAFVLTELATGLRRRRFAIRDHLWIGLGFLIGLAPLFPILVGGWDGYMAGSYGVTLWAPENAPTSTPGTRPRTSRGSFRSRPPGPSVCSCPAAATPAARTASRVASSTPGCAAWRSPGSSTRCGASRTPDTGCSSSGSCSRSCSGDPDHRCSAHASPLRDRDAALYVRRHLNHPGRRRDARAFRPARWSRRVDGRDAAVGRLDGLELRRLLPCVSKQRPARRGDRPRPRDRQARCRRCRSGCSLSPASTGATARCST